MSRTRVATRRQIALTLLAASAIAVSVAVPAQAKPAAHRTLTDRYSAVGTSHIASINADLPIAKANLVETLDLKTLRIVRGTLPIAPQTVTFTALGAIPVRSTVTLVQATPITGSIRPTSKGNVLTTSVAYTIKLSNIEAQVLGQWVPLGVGNNCQTIDPAVIRLSSPKGTYFDIFKGGVVTGTYTIGKFSNCAPLNLPDPFGIGSVTVNSLVPGSNNTVSVSLSRGHVVAG